MGKLAPEQMVVGKLELPEAAYLTTLIAAEEYGRPLRKALEREQPEPARSG